MTKKHRNLLLEQVKEKDILLEEMGNDRYVAVTKNTVYFVSIGISSGHFFGKKVKSFPIDKISSIDLSKKIMASYLEITSAGMGGSNHSRAGYTEFNENRVFFAHSKKEKFQKIVEKIRDLMNSSKSGKNENSGADEIEKLHSLMKKGIITEKEFEKKKKELLD